MLREKWEKPPVAIAMMMMPRTPSRNNLWASSPNLPPAPRLIDFKKSSDDLQRPLHLTVFSYLVLRDNRCVSAGIVSRILKRAAFPHLPVQFCRSRVFL